MDEKKSAGIPWLGLGFLLSVAGSGFYFSFDSKFLLGQIASLALGAFGLHGLWRGGFRKIVMLPLTVGALFLLAAKPDFADPVVKSIAGHSSVPGNMMACGLVMVVSFLVSGALVKYVRNRVIVKRPVLLGADRFVGTSVGLAEGGLVTLAMCWVAIMAEPQMLRLKSNPGTAPGTGRYAIATSILDIVREIDESPLRTFIRDNNALRDVPAVKAAFAQLEQAASDPDFWNKAPAELSKSAERDESGIVGDVVKKLQKDASKRSEAYRRAPAPSR